MSIYKLKMLKKRKALLTMRMLSNIIYTSITEGAKTK